MRPRYESAKDRQNEAIPANVLRAMGYDVHKLPDHYRIDYAVMRDGRCVAFAEIKTRTNESAAYDTYMISLSKLVAAQSLSDFTGLTVSLIVQWTDRIGITRLCPDGVITPDVFWGGRKDRGDDQDQETVIHIPIERFKPL